MDMGLRTGAAALDAFGSMLAASTDRQPQQEPKWTTEMGLAAGFQQITVKPVPPTPQSLIEFELAI
jgi:hypothetical protein